MSAGETISHRWRQVRGLVQDYVGQLTGSSGKRVRGHGKMVGGEAQHRAAGARDRAKDGIASVRDRTTGRKD